MEKYFVFRNYTVENLFKGFNCKFGGYDNILDVDLESDSFIWFYLLPVNNDISLLIKDIGNIREKLDIVLSTIPKTKAKLIFTLDNVYNIKWENHDNKLDQAIIDYNNYVYSLADSDTSIKVVNISEFYSRYSNTELIDWKFFYMSQTLINPKLSKDFISWFEKKLDAINFVRKKCIVLDFDNTLWGGILGEDGASGIKIGNTYPGNVFLEFQKSLKLASDFGIILAGCSKNNEKDVFELWEKHPEIILKKDDFTSLKINWNNKADNIREIAKEINIGLDSIVFIDDNPVERNLVKSMIPDVTVPDFPTKIYEINSFFKKVYEEYFQLYRLTVEDRDKSNQYKANSIRKELQSTLSVEDYLRSLETVVEIQELSEMNIERIAQMTQKTNQFNLTTKRYTVNDILDLKNSGSLIKCISVKDKFGDSGITGLIILNKEDRETYIIDTLLMSCRILGRNIEKSFLESILNELFDMGVKKVKSSYIPTTKNEQVMNFYENMNFNIIEDSFELKLYEYLIEKKIILNNYVKIKYYEK